MSLIRAAVDSAVGQAIAEHPKYFTPQGQKSARTLIVRKVMAALRDGGDKGPPDPQDEAQNNQPQILYAAAGSREALGYANLRLVAGATAPNKLSDGSIIIMPAANCAAVFAFADMPPQQAWLFVTNRQQLGAWGEFFREKLPNIGRREIAHERNGERGMLLPWPYPPSKEGKIYQADEVAA
jgi:hypothetical protein